MTTIEKCPMCGESHEIQNTQFGTLYRCLNQRCYHIYDNVFTGNNEKVIEERRLNAIYNFIEKYPFKPKDGVNWYWKFYYSESEKVLDDDCMVNVYQLMKNYPYRVTDRIDCIIVNLSHLFPSLSNTFCIQQFISMFPRAFYCESADFAAEVECIFSALINLNYIEKCNEHASKYLSNYRISIEGWKRIAELETTQAVNNYGFIAMAFSGDVAYIERVFKQAIQEAGFEPRIIKDKEHNNYIMPEIFHEIRRSKFLVVDVTKQNYGAYYEAGYAQALGKEVIVCCKKEVFDDPQKKPHFDIAQKSMIIWTDENDLLYRLKRRIGATVK